MNGKCSETIRGHETFVESDQQSRLSRPASEFGDSRAGNKIIPIATELSEPIQYWNGTDSTGRLVASSMYFYTIQIGEIRKSRKLLLLR